VEPGQQDLHSRADITSEKVRRVHLLGRLPPQRDLHRQRRSGLAGQGLRLTHGFFLPWPWTTSGTRKTRNEHRLLLGNRCETATPRAVIRLHAVSRARLSMTPLAIVTWQYQVFCMLSLGIWLTPRETYIVMRAIKRFVCVAQRGRRVWRHRISCCCVAIEKPFVTSQVSRANFTILCAVFSSAFCVVRFRWIPGYESWSRRKASLDRNPVRLKENHYDRPGSLGGVKLLFCRKFFFPETTVFRRFTDFLVLFRPHLNPAAQTRTVVAKHPPPAKTRKPFCPLSWPVIGRLFMTTEFIRTQYRTQVLRFAASKCIFRG